jgi:hypothetical protein
MYTFCSLVLLMLDLCIKADASEVHSWQLLQLRDNPYSFEKRISSFLIAAQYVAPSVCVTREIV